MTTARLLLHCPDQPGILAQITNFITVNGGNIVYLDQYVDHIEGVFFAHSFLPAFVGARPYHQAYERGVKIIGATSHYVTAELDAGSIIKQDVVHITHKDTPHDLIGKGKDLEKIVLSRAVQKHIDRKVLVYKNKTVIFN